MATYKTFKASGTAAVDWHDLKDTGEILENETGGMLVIRCSQASRVAVGVVDPVASTTAGVPAAADEGVLVHLAAGAANPTIWVQTPADQSQVDIEVDIAFGGPAAIALS